MTFSERLVHLKTSRGLLQKNIADSNGISVRALRYYEQGVKEPTLPVLLKFANFFGVSLDYLVGLTDRHSPFEDQNQSSTHKIPILGTVIAGVPIRAIEEVIGYEEITSKMAKSGEFFALRIRGDSMAPQIAEGDVIIVKRQSSADNNDIVVVCVNGDEATCKKLIKHKDGISLVSFNPAYEPLYYTSDEVDGKPVEIIGKIVELRRRFF